MPDNRLLTITEVREATGLESSALRFYERTGLIASAGRAGGRRQYHPSVLERLGAIALFQEVGFTIAEIEQLLRSDSSPRRWRSMAEQKLAEIDAHIEQATMARELLASTLRCTCSDFTSCGLVGARVGRHREATSRLSLKRT